MAKHIHIYLPKARVRTGDATWEESKHKRDDSGKFGSGGGGAKPDLKTTPAKGFPASGGGTKPAATSASWPKNEHGNHAPPVGTKVTNPNVGMDGPGVVRSVVGNIAKVAYKVKGPDGKVYNRLGDFHVTKVYPASKSAPASSDKPPTTLVHGGKKHTATGKTGKTPGGEVTHEYEAVDDQGKRTGARVWRTASGKVIPD